MYMMSSIFTITVMRMHTIISKCESDNKNKVYRIHLIHAKFCLFGMVCIGVHKILKLYQGCHVEKY